MDQAHLAQLLMRHRVALYAYIFASVRHHADAEDILQNVSLAAVESSAQLNDESGFLPWTLEIARRRILKHFRYLDRVQALAPEVLTQLSDATLRVERLVPSSRYQAALQGCLEQLPPASRRLMQWRYDGSVQNASELASRVSRSVQSIYAQIKRIKVALRSCVEQRLAKEL
ncbi:MAG: sigma-70 family RNA polymerase sigma factor [Planctomycetaceae bacterium]|nr:sigma-70 family RNA polymerase sigma factor [Planctomycetaceae bacterium]